MKSHLSDDEKKHVCLLCGNRFAKIGLLKNHITTHSNVRLFTCEVNRDETKKTLKKKFSVSPLQKMIIIIVFKKTAEI
jgi:uncharacterized Zn-finger protein